MKYLITMIFVFCSTIGSAHSTSKQILPSCLLRCFKEDHKMHLTEAKNLQNRNLQQEDEEIVSERIEDCISTDLALHKATFQIFLQGSRSKEYIVEHCPSFLRRNTIATLDCLEETGLFSDLSMMNLTVSLIGQTFLTLKCLNECPDNSYAFTKSGD